MDEGLASKVHVIDGKQVEIKRLFPIELTLKVQNLPPSTTDHSLHAFFSKFGTILGAEVKKDRLTGRSCCRGHVCFASQQELDHAVRSKPHYINGKTVSANYNTQEFTLYIAQLPPNVSDECIRKYFEQFGLVCRCEIARDSQEGELQEMSRVIFSSSKGLNNALSVNPHVIDGVIIETKGKKNVVVPMLYVGGLSPETTSQMLHDVFSKLGTLVEYEVMVDKRTKRSKGFGYVKYSSSDEMTKALLGGPYVLDGRVLTVMPNY